MNTQAERMLGSMGSRRGRRAWAARVDWRRPLLAAAACAIGALAAAGGAAAQVPSPAADRLWGGCSLGNPDTRAVQNAGVGTFDFIVLYSLLPNDGQAVAGGHTGPIICTANRVSIQAVSESTQVAGIDILAPVQGLATLYTQGGTAKKRICHQVLGSTRCHTVEPGAGSGCVLSASTIGSIARLIERQSNRTIVGADFAFAVAYTLGGEAALPTVCAVQGSKATEVMPGPGERPEALTGSVDDVENIFTTRYKVRASGKFEARPCHTVADRTDCFRVFK